jgi:hypothetical protein
MFLLKNRNPINYYFGEKTFYNSFHAGQDYKANYVNVYAPFDCTCDSFSDNGGGLWLQFHHDNYLIMIAHLSKVIKTGHVASGEVVGVTGNSGAYTTGPHAHVQIKDNGKLIDPERFNWKGDTMEVSQASVTAWDMAYNGTTPTDEDIYKNIRDLYAKYTAIKPGVCSCGFTADDRKLLDKLKTVIKY